MLGHEELATWAAVFGVTDEQIRRDHLVSHILAGLANLDGDGLVFYGGTALARTHLPRFRLSEDVDLLVTPRREWAERIERHLPSVLRRGFGPVQWRPTPTEVPSGAASMLVAGDRAVRLQLVSLDREERRWPVERRQLEMRYADVPPTALTVPTVAAFAAMKTLAWEERGAARDLADLTALAELGALDVDAAGLVREVGGWRPHPAHFERLPAATRNAWHVDLSHQMASHPIPRRASGPCARPGEPPSDGHDRRSPTHPIGGQDNPLADGQPVPSGSHHPERLPVGYGSTWCPSPSRR